MNRVQSIKQFTIKRSKNVLKNSYKETIELDINKINSSGGILQFRDGEEVDLNSPEFKRLRELIKTNGIDYSKPRIVVTKIPIGNKGKVVYVVFDGHHRLYIYKEMNYKTIVVDVIDLTGISVEDKLLMQGLLNHDDGKMGNSFEDILKNLRIVISQEFNLTLYETDSEYKNKEDKRITKLIKSWKEKMPWTKSSVETWKALMPLLCKDGSSCKIITPVLKKGKEVSWYSVCNGESIFFPDFKIPGIYNSDYFVINSDKSSWDVLSTIDLANYKEGSPRSRRIYLAPKGFYLNEEELWEARLVLKQVYEKVRNMHIEKQIQYDLAVDKNANKQRLINRRKKHYDFDGFLPMILDQEWSVMDSKRETYEFNQ